MGVREGLLALLRHGPSHGYQLKTAFESATGGVWPLNVGQVYSTLDRLVRDGLVAAEGDEGHRTYTLTARGIDELDDWWQAVPGDEPPPRDELVVKVLLAVDAGRDHALDVITEQRRALMTMLQQRRRAPKANGTLPARLVSDALTVRTEAELRWLDLCEERLLAAAGAGTDEEPVARAGGRRRGGRR